MTQERFSNLTVLNSHKERTGKFASDPPDSPTLKEVVTGPRPLKTAPRTLKLTASRAVTHHVSES